MTGPLFNRLISSRIAEGVRKIYGEEISLDTVAPELAIGATVEDDRAENMAATGSWLWAARFSEIARVGEFSAVEIFNPIGSGILVVIKSWSCDVTGVVVQLQNHPGVADLDATSTAALLDGRTWPAGAGIGATAPIVRSRHNAAQQGISIWDRHISNTEHQVGSPADAWAVLFPDQAFTLWGSVVITGIFVNFRGYLRAFKVEEARP